MIGPVKKGGGWWSWGDTAAGFAAGGGCLLLVMLLASGSLALIVFMVIARDGIAGAMTPEFIQTIIQGLLVLAALGIAGWTVQRIAVAYFASRTIPAEIAPPPVQTFIVGGGGAVREVATPSQGPHLPTEQAPLRLPAHQVTRRWVGPSPTANGAGSKPGSGIGWRGER